MYKDIDNQDITIGCKVELMDGDMIHNARVIEDKNTLYIFPGIEKEKDPLEIYSKDQIFQGRVIERQ